MMYRLLKYFIILMVAALLMAVVVYYGELSNYVSALNKLKYRY